MHCRYEPILYAPPSIIPKIFKIRNSLAQQISYDKQGLGLLGCIHWMSASR